MEFYKNIISSTSLTEEYLDFIDNFSTADIERELFYGESQITEEAPSRKRIILKVLDGEVYGIAKQKLPPVK